MAARRPFESREDDRHFFGNDWQGLSTKLDVGVRRLGSDYRTLYRSGDRFLLFVYFATVALSTLIMPLLLVHYYSTLHSPLYPL